MRNAIAGQTEMVAKEKHKLFNNLAQVCLLLRGEPIFSTNHRSGDAERRGSPSSGFAGATIPPLASPLPGFLLFEEWICNRRS